MSSLDDNKPKMDTRLGDPLIGRDPSEEAVVSSDALMGRRREIVILHAGLRYRLRITANDKLILTK